MKLPQKFTGDENHIISIAEAVDFINRYQSQNEPDAVPGGFFAHQAVQPLISQPRAVGVRYYYGLSESGIQLLLLVGVNADRDDILDGEPVRVSVLNPPFSRRGLVVPALSAHEISLEDAARLTFNHRNNAPGDPCGGYFGQRDLQKVLSHPGCIGIRFWFGASKDSTRNIVMSGVNRYGMEMFDGHFIEMSSLCPPLCSEENLLNSGSFSADDSISANIPVKMLAESAVAA